MATQTNLIVLAQNIYGGTSYPTGALITDPDAVAGIQAPAAYTRKVVAIKVTGSGTMAPPPTVTGGSGTSTGATLTVAQYAALANQPLDALNIASQATHLVTLDGEVLALQQRANSSDIVDGNQNASLTAGPCAPGPRRHGSRLARRQGRRAAGRQQASCPVQDRHAHRHLSCPAGRAGDRSAVSSRAAHASPCRGSARRRTPAPR